MLRLTVLILALVAGVGCTSDGPTVNAEDATDHIAQAGALRASGDVGPEVLAGLARIRMATGAFHNRDAATGAGYVVWSPDPFVPNATCPSSALGQMGYHLVNVVLRGGAANPETADAEIDPLRPEMLLYEKRPDGNVHLVGVEYLVFTSAWERVHGAGAAPPEVLGEPLLASTHTFPGNASPIPHYELHVWLWAANPLGMFSPWNPSVTC